MVGRQTKGDSMCKRLTALLLVVALSSSVFSQVITPVEARSTIASMKLDLDLLSRSIENYKQKTAELKTLIAQSLDDLETQKALLTDSENKLKETEKQYAALEADYQSLNRSLKTSVMINKVLAVVSIASLTGLAISQFSK